MRSLGVIDKLGRDEPLLLKAEKNEKYLRSIGIKNSNNRIIDEIGLVHFNCSRGELSNRTQEQGLYLLKEKIVYTWLDFAYNKKTGEFTEGDSTRARYNITFGEQMDRLKVGALRKKLLKAITAKYNLIPSYFGTRIGVQCILYQLVWERQLKKIQI